MPGGNPYGEDGVDRTLIWWMLSLTPAQRLEVLRQFLASPVRWGELDVRCDPGGRLVLRHDAFEGVDGPAGRCPESLAG